MMQLVQRRKTNLINGVKYTNNTMRKMDSRRLKAFAIGVAIGVVLALWVHHRQNNQGAQHSVDIFQYFFHKPISGVSNVMSYVGANYDFAYARWLKRLFSAQSIPLDPDEHRYRNGSSSHDGKAPDATSSIGTSLNNCITCTAVMKVS